MGLPPAQDTIDILLNYFQQLIPLTNAEKELVAQKFHSRLY